MSCCGVLAEYKPIPEHLCSQYKQEMEQIIDEEYPKVIDKIDKYVEEAKNYKVKIKRGGCIPQEYANMGLIAEICIESADTKTYRKLLNVSEEKYLHIKHTIRPSSDAYFLAGTLATYFKQCNVSSAKLMIIMQYMKNKVEVVEKYVKEVEVYCK